MTNEPERWPPLEGMSDHELLMSEGTRSAFTDERITRDSFDNELRIRRRRDSAFDCAWLDVLSTFPLNAVRVCTLTFPK